MILKRREEELNHKVEKGKYTGNKKVNPSRSDREGLT
jgi:hypothetical protein